MQDLWQIRPHSGALSGREHHDVEITHAAAVGLSAVVGDRGKDWA